jgi:hypothetical protein
MVTVYGFAPRRTLHTARIGRFAKVLYPYYPLFGQEFEVLGAAGGERDLVYVRLPNRTTRGVPAWMFDETLCARVRCAERPMVDCRALLRLTHLLDSARPAPRSAGNERPPASPQKAAAASAARSPKLLPLEAAAPKVRLPSGPRLQCLHLLQQLLQAVVLQANSHNASPDDER